jgi:hypothetical protein
MPQSLLYQLADRGADGNTYYDWHKKEQKGKRCDQCQDRSNRLQPHHEDVAVAVCFWSRGGVSSSGQ